MDVTQKILNAIEHNIRHLPFAEQFEVLAGLACTGKINNLPYRTAEEKFAFERRLKTIEPEVTPGIAQAVAKSLMLELIQREIEKRVAENSVRFLPTEEARPESPEIVVEDDGQPLKADEFSEFLMLFNRAYTLAPDLPETDTERRLTESRPSDREFYLKALKKSQGRPLARKQSKPALIITKIHKSSPLTFNVLANVGYLTMAVILSGGKVSIWGLKFQVPPLGDGLAKLRDVFVKEQRRTPSKKAKKGKRPR